MVRALKMMEVSTLANTLCSPSSGAASISMLPAFRNEHPVDTIGAGDNFAAGFLSSLLDGGSFVQAARFANATAAISVGAPGATNGVQSKSQVEAFLQSQT